MRKSILEYFMGKAEAFYGFFVWSRISNDKNSYHLYGVKKMKNENSKREFKHWPYLWLAVGFILLIFSNGIHRIIPLAAWLAPILLLRFTRKNSLLLFLPVNIIAWVIMTYNLYGSIMPIWVGIITGIIYGLIFFISFAADKKIKVKGFLKTLVFPLAVVSIEYLISLTPLNSWFSLAYTQNNLVLMQLGSITGYLGISFMIAWFASTVNWAWEHEFSFNKIKKGVAIYLSISIIVLIFGGAYLTFLPTDSNTIKTASITRSFDMDVEAGKCNKDVPCLEKLFNKSLNEFLESSKLAVDNGAQIIVWQENALAVYKRDEVEFIAKVKEFAIDEKVYMIVGMYVLSEDRSSDENQAILITPSGETEEYLKNYLTPGDNHITGDGKILVHDSEYGKLGLIICQDAHYLNFVKQAKEVDIMLILNHNWESITPYYAEMSFFRAIEQGFNIVSAAYHGLSYAVDYHGDVLAEMNDFTTEERIMIADIPKQGIKTIYSQIGDFFAWLCILGLFTMIWLSFSKLKKE